VSDDSTAAPLRDWWSRPRVVLPFVGAIVVLVALLTPQSTLGRMGDSRLSSHLTGSLGAGALAESAARFGYRVIRRDVTPVPDSASAAGTTIHAVLAPRILLTPDQAHAYLERVRQGDALLFALERHDPLADSLGVWRTRAGGELRVARGDSASCDRRRDLTPSLWPDGKVHLAGLRYPRGTPANRTVFAVLDLPRGGDSRVRTSRPEAAPMDAAAGFTLGKGRVVVLADPDLLRNDVLRRCQWGADVVALRMLEWLRAGGEQPRTALVFDEFHQGFGPALSLSGTVGRFLTGHPAGRAILQLVLAGLVLLLAAAPRPIVPRDREMIERRDPLEQVDALAHAYEQVEASRTLTLRLLHGVRRRVDGTGSWLRRRADEDFLSDAEQVDPSLAADVALIRRALREPVARRDLHQVGAALRRLEDSLTTTRA
jgi:hypothetical protein